MMLDLKATRYYLSCYGTETSRWPEPEAGRTALAVYAKELGADLTQAQRLEAAIGSTAVRAPSDLLPRRIMANLPAQEPVAPKEIAANDMTPRKFNWRIIAAAFVIAGAVSVSTISLQNPPTEEPAVDTEIWREAALDMGVDDVFDWVYNEDG